MSVYIWLILIRNIRILTYNFRFTTFNFIYIYIIYLFINISRFSHCTKLSQCREQEGSATLVIVTMHLLSTLPIQSERYSSYGILFATLRYDVGLFCQNVLSLTVKHLTLALLSPLLSPLFSPSGGRRNVSKRKIAQCSLQ